jgi:DNA-binding transcriptional regulator YdaS (Cro superfamily)
MKSPSPLEALVTACDIYGSENAMAVDLGVSQPTVWRWINQSKSRRLPAEYVLRVEAATGVSRHLLRPDIYPEDTPRGRRAAAKRNDK